MRLRLATRAAHQVVEELPLMARLFATDFLLDELANLLGRLAPVHRALEEVLADCEEAAAIGYRPRTPLLEADLVLLGGTEEPPPSRQPVYDGSAARLGALYVIEGSVLGGQVIQRQLAAHFGPNIGASISYYRPYGPDVSAQWQRFRQVLNQKLSPDTLAEAEAAAHRTFSFFANALT